MGTRWPGCNYYFYRGCVCDQTAIYPGYHIATQQHSVRNSVLCNEIVHIGGRNLFKSSSGSIRLYQSDENVVIAPMGKSMV